MLQSSVPNISTRQQSQEAKNLSSGVEPVEELGLPYDEEEPLDEEELFGEEAPRDGEAIDDSKKIHVLGSGSIGCFVAHALRKADNTLPITFLLHREGMFRALRKAKYKVKVKTGVEVIGISGFRAQLVPKNRPNAASDATNISEGSNRPRRDSPIHNLIVTVKAHATVAALKPLVHRLGRDSTLVFLQNGMGVVDEVNEHVFPDQATRPNYVLGIVSHGVHMNQPFSVNHAGFGTINLGLLPRIPFEVAAQRKDKYKNVDIWGSEAQYLVKTLTDVPVLAAASVPTVEILQLQLEKLAVNCVINPLTVLLDCRNESILHNGHLSRTIRLLLAEISLVIQSLPELKGIPDVEFRFSPQRLESMVVQTATRTGKNISSMLQDVRKNKETEIQYINGYIVKRGEEVGIRPILNYMIKTMVNGKRWLYRGENDKGEHVPAKN